MTDDNNPLAGTVADLYRHRAPGGRELSVGLLVPDEPLSRLAESLLRQLGQLEYVRKLTRIVHPVGRATRTNVAPLFALFCTVDETRNADDNLLAAARPQGAQYEVESLILDGTDKSYGQVRVLGLDVLLVMGCEVEDCKLAGLCSAGTWRFDFGIGTGGSWRLVGAGDFFAAAPDSRVRLWQQDATPAVDQLLSELVLRADPSYSLVQSRRRVLLESCLLVIMALYRLHSDEQPRTWPGAEPAPGLQTGNEPRTRLPVLAWLARPFARRAARLLSGRPAVVPIWKIALRRVAAGAPIDGVLRDRSGFRFLSAPRGYAWADPHLVDYQGRTLLFAEELKINTDASGKIVCLEIDGNGAANNRLLCVDRPYHLSFPQVFAYGGEYFMIPESMMDGTVQLLRARRFPDDWVLERVLFRGRAVDTVHWFDEPSGKWLFVTSMGSMVGQYPFTMVFVADSLTAPWQLHPCSPIATTVQTERNGGALFRNGAKLIRPVQDGRLRYGHSLQWQEITSLGPTSYSERPCGRVEPNWAPGMLATHSYTRSRDWEALDALIVAEPATESGR